MDKKTTSDADEIEPTGFRRSINAIYDNVPQYALGTLGACVGLVFWLWLDVRDLRSAIKRIDIEQTPTRLCERIGACLGRTGGAKDEDNIQWNIIMGLRQTLNERGERISRLEEKVYELVTKPTARADPFTGTMGKALEERIKQLEPGGNR